MNEKDEKEKTLLDKMLSYVGKINNSQILEYERKKDLGDNIMEWKIFITELFELINSPNSSNLHDHYIIHIKNIHPSEEFIL